jgi:hypothetical protein
MRGTHTKMFTIKRLVLAAVLVLTAVGVAFLVKNRAE